ncbi:unnamed protein product [Aphanomyces euteiches]|uniref:Uncharacterized protein n=1 Tax=Aphanomyces euteiches TaxID=100861 RepID=A0A6G0XC63_9STRA|nr:hypothetical protein Ae201684_006252 [Aphanomyces euteiches]KAH9068578.1 hypothetical protein Ae201684P_004280 [Aphanomyces euteiches]KAH9144147.1 hypothetical protein AeRB84_011896 [Aphanomyces euteiches]
MQDAHHQSEALCMYKSGKCGEKRAWKNGKQLKLCEAHRIEQNAIKMRSDKSLSLRRKMIREEKKKLDRLRRAEERKKMYWDASSSSSSSDEQMQWNGPFVDISDEIVTATCLETLERLGTQVLMPLYEEHPELSQAQKVTMLKFALMEMHKKMMHQIQSMEQAGCLFHRDASGSSPSRIS